MVSRSDLRQSVAEAIHAPQMHGLAHWLGDIYEALHARCITLPRMKGLDSDGIANHTAEIIEHFSWMVESNFYDRNADHRERNGR